MQFSKRYGYDESQKLALDSMPTSLRSRIWNAFRRLLDEYPGGNDLIPKIWDEYFKFDIDDLQTHIIFDTHSYDLNGIRDAFYKLEWYKVYDFIEYLLKNIPSKTLVKIDRSRVNSLDDFRERIIQIFKDEGVMYRIVDTYVIPITEDVESHEVERVFVQLRERGYVEAHRNMQKALDFLAKNRNRIRRML
jgi:hypothetical protein